MESLERTLRTVLSPITHNLPTPVQEVATTLLGDSCYRSLVHNLTISDSACMKLAFSKVLGLAIVGASSVVKVPQIIKLINSGSAEGVSLIGYLLETASFMISLVYNVRNQFPFSSFGETAFILVQNVCICFLVLEYSGKGNMGSLMIAALAGAGFLLFNSDIVDMELLQYLQMGAGIVGTASKLPQILGNWREGGLDSCLLSLVFTTLTEVDDKVILYGFIGGLVLNIVLALQMLVYWNAPASKNTTEHKLTPAGKREIRDPVERAAEKVKAQVSGAEKKGSPSTRRRG
ncbi:hypothetical protein Q7P36_007806 [Cladosporium allicinum]